MRWQEMNCESLLSNQATVWGYLCLIWKVLQWLLIMLLPRVSPPINRCILCTHGVCITEKSANVLLPFCRHHAKYHSPMHMPNPNPIRTRSSQTITPLTLAAKIWEQREREERRGEERETETIYKQEEFGTARRKKWLFSVHLIV